MKTTLLAIVASQRRDGNSYSLAKTVLENIDVEPRIIQLADEHIEFCTVCEECIDKNCVLSDDFDKILTEMENTDGIIFVIPRYLTVPSKFLAFLERLATIEHMRRLMAYAGEVKNPNYKLFTGKKPFAVFALSGSGKFKKEYLRPVTDNLEFLGLTPITHDRHPFIAVNVKAGDQKGEVLRNKTAVEQCTRMARQIAMIAKKQQSGSS